MRKTGQGQIFCTGTEFHGNDALGNDFRSLRTNNVETQDTVSLRIGDDLDHATGGIRRHGTAIGRKREAAYVVLFAFSLQLLFGLTDPGHFGEGVDHVRDAVVVHLRLVAGNALGNHHTFFRRFVCQHRATNDITYRPHTRRFGFAVIVYKSEAALVHGHAGIFCQGTVSVRTTTNGNDQLVKLRFLLAFGIFVADIHQLALDLSTGHAGTSDDVQALLLEMLERILGNLLVHRRQETVLGFQDSHFSAQTSPHTAELQTDHTSTDNAKALGHFSELQRTFGIDNVLAIKRCRRNLDRLGTGRQNDVVGFVGLGLAIFISDFHLATSQQLAVAVNGGYAIRLEQIGNTASQLLNDAGFTLHHLRHIDINTLGHDTHGRVIVAGFLKLVSHLKQSLGRDAAHVQAGAAQNLAFAVFAGPGLNTGRFQAELCRLDSSNVTAGACTNDNNIELIGHNLSCYRIR